MIEEYRIVLEKEKTIYASCNKMKNLKNNTLMAQVFVPKENVNYFKDEISRMNRNMRLNIDLRGSDFNQRRYTPPTYFKTSEFTKPFQDVVDTYGIPRYGEVNPG